VEQLRSSSSKSQACTARRTRGHAIASMATEDRNVRIAVDEKMVEAVTNNQTTSRFRHVLVVVV